MLRAGRFAAMPNRFESFDDSFVSPQKKDFYVE
jgi:hypothetical protein